MDKCTRSPLKSSSSFLSVQTLIVHTRDSGMILMSIQISPSTSTFRNHSVVTFHRVGGGGGLVQPSLLTDPLAVSLKKK